MVTTRRPSCIITIDTEGDDLWSRPQVITTRNAAFIPRFQHLCEKYALKPTYLTTWEMALDRQFREAIRAAHASNLCEIGAHPHAWNSPPLTALTKDDLFYQPYLVEYPRQLMTDKIRSLTDLLEDTFGVKMMSHRAGRWALDEAYAEILIESGYRVDCSVTPHVDWRSTCGSPDGNGGPDYSSFPKEEYFIDARHISRPGNSPLLEIPMTIVSNNGSSLLDTAKKMLPNKSIMRRGLERVSPSTVWLRPNGRNLDAMLRIVADAVTSKRNYVEFMLHSSELMPGGSPYYRSASSIERLYDHLETLFAAVSEHFVGRTLSEHYGYFLSSNSSS